jgi:hypothetical protein
MTTATETISAATLIDHDHMEAAGRYILAIVAGDPVCVLLGEPHLTAESERLWDLFVARYAAVATGAYAKHGADLLRIVLSSL